jgi:hypothetical protein
MASCENRPFTEQLSNNSLIAMELDNVDQGDGDREDD